MTWTGARAERWGLALVAAGFLVSMALVVARPYSFSDAPIPDEASNHGWATLYNQGRYSLSLSDWFGVSARKELYANGTGIHWLSLNPWWHDADGLGGRDDLSVNVSLDDKVPLPEAVVAIYFVPGQPPLRRATDAEGSALFLNLPQRDLEADASYALHRTESNGPDVDLLESQLLPRSVGLTPYQVTVVIRATRPLPGISDATLVLHDQLGLPVPGAEIALASKRLPSEFHSLGSTDGAGELSLRLDTSGNFILWAEKPSLKGGIPQAALVRKGGDYRMVNVYPPGYALLLAAFMKVGLEGWVSPLSAGITTIATYCLGRRLFGWKVASAAALLTTTCSIAIVMTYARGMADYTAMAFCFLGLWLFVESMLAPPRGWAGLALGLAAGLAFGTAISMRYFVAAGLLGPPLVLSFSRAKGLLLQRVGKAGTALPRPILRRFLAALVGFAFPMALIAAYGAVYLGSPLSMGYLHNMGVAPGPSGQPVPRETAIGDFVLDNLNPLAALPTLGRRLLLLTIAMPFVLLLPLAVVRRYRSPGVMLLGSYFLSNLVTFSMSPWVASWRDLSRSLEDLRYFLPGVPAASILAANALLSLHTPSGIRQALLILTVLAMVGVGLVVANLTIGLILARPR